MQLVTELRLPSLHEITRLHKSSFGQLATVFILVSLNCNRPTY